MKSRDIEYTNLKVYAITIGSIQVGDTTLYGIIRSKNGKTPTTMKEYYNSIIANQITEEDFEYLIKFIEYQA